MHDEDCEGLAKVFSESAGWQRRTVLGAAGAVAGGVLLGSTRALANASSRAEKPLQDRIQGTVIVRADPDYDVWREAMIFQDGKSPRRPDMIVQAHTVDDVVQAVRYARDHKLKVTTRCGGHNMSACFLRNTGMLIDVSRLDGVEVDPVGKRAVAGPAVFGGFLLETLRKHDLAFPIAHASLVPLGGFLLGGGLGLNANGWCHGRSVFAILGVDVVTADGELVHASRTQNPDLFWAVQGGGPGLFGVVVKFHLQCYDLPRAIVAANHVFGLNDLVAAISAVEANGHLFDRNMELAFSVMRAPPELAARAKADGGNVAYLSLTAFGADEAAARAILKPIADLPVMNLAWAQDRGQITTFNEILESIEGGPAIHNCLWDNIFTDRTAEVAKIVLEHVPSCPADDAMASFYYIGGHALPDAACSVTGRFYVAYYLNWSDPGQRGAVQAFSAAVMNDIKPFANGSYINEMNQEGRPQDIHTCYTPDAWAKFTKLRTKWDPQGVFHSFIGQS